MPKNPLKVLAELFVPVEKNLPKGTFSPLARAIDAAPQDRATGDQWANYFVNRNAVVGGQSFPVRPEELRMTGLGDTLMKNPSETFSRSDLLARQADVAPTVYPKFGSLQGDRPQYEEYVSPGVMKGYIEALTHRLGLGYEAPHFDPLIAQDLISHSRMSTRDLPSGRAVHIDEIQSDLHQAARDAGGYLDKDSKRRLKELTKEQYRIYENMGGMNGTPFAEIRSHPDYDRYAEMGKEIDRLSDMPPWAPYAKTYHEQEFNKALRRAADKDSAVTWTTGRQQANRWGDDLGDFKNLRYEPGKYMRYDDPAGHVPNAGFPIHINPETGRPEVMTKHEGHRSFASMFGNDIAQRLMKGETIPEGWIGGGGMRDFYDRAIPKYAESFARRFPGSKVEDVSFIASRPQADSGSMLNYQLFLDDLRSAGFEPADGRFGPMFRAAAERYAGGDRDPNLLADMARLHLREPQSVDPSVLGNMIEHQIQQNARKPSETGLYDKVHGLTLSPEARRWIREHGLPIASTSPLAVMATQDEE